MRYGPEAGVREGMLRLYYDGKIRLSLDGMNTSTLTLSDPTDMALVLEELLTFDDGIHFSDSTMGTFQPVPLPDGHLRFFFEGFNAGEHPSGSIFSIDSLDTDWDGTCVGPDDSTCFCDESDYQDDSCDTTWLAEDWMDDAPTRFYVRQYKLLLPSLDSWTWDPDTEIGTQMIVTVHFIVSPDEEGTPECITETAFNMGYATWDGTDWQLELDDEGCPILEDGVQEPVPLHMRDQLHKVYYSYNDDEEVTHGSDKDFMVTYVDGSIAGDPSLIEMDDWESFEDSRVIEFRFPDGSDVGEDFLSSDYMVFYPTEDPLLQVFIGNGLSLSGPGAAVLLNP
jgi:hypothetical protein